MTGFEKEIDMAKRLMEVAQKIEDFLTDNEVSPKPVSKLTFVIPTSIFFEQIVECASYWSPDDRLAVGSIIVDSPLKDQGATDIRFVLTDDVPMGDQYEEQIPVYYFPITDDDELTLALEIHGNWRGADVNRSADAAALRMVTRELDLGTQFTYLYNFVRDVASNGFGRVNLNAVLMGGSIDYKVYNFLKDAERELISRAVSALNKFEGRDPSSDEVWTASHLGVRGDE